MNSNCLIYLFFSEFRIKQGFLKFFKIVLTTYNKMVIAQKKFKINFLQKYKNFKRI